MQLSKMNYYDSVPKSVYVLLFSIIFANLFFFNKINSILRNYK